jgi:acetyltransferase
MEDLRSMFSACSPKSLYRRYDRRVPELPGDLAAQLCPLDGQREMTIVAEIEVDGVPKIVGVGQLLPDPDHVTAEYAVLVADPWQGEGLGSELTDFCLEVAQRWGIKRIVGEFSPSNVRIIRILESRNFQLRRDQQQRLVYGEKTLG